MLQGYLNEAESIRDTSDVLCVVTFATLVSAAFRAMLGDALRLLWQATHTRPAVFIHVSVDRRSTKSGETPAYLELACSTLVHLIRTDTFRWLRSSWRSQP